MKQFWLSNISKDGKEAYTAYLKGLPELIALRGQLEHRLTDIRNTRLKKSDFDGAWPYNQATLNGQEKEMLNLLTWLNFD